jgi:hypothetical protein
MPLDVGGKIISSTSLISNTFSKSIIQNGLLLNVDVADSVSYPGSGSVLYDLTDYKMNGSIQAGVTYTSGNTGALTFDNSASAYIQFTNHQLFNFGTGDFAFEIWIRPTSFSSYTHMIAMPDQGTMALKANVSDGQIYFYSPAFSTYGSSSGWTLSLNNWNHVVFTRISNVAYCYLNGILKGKISGFNNSFLPNAPNIGNGWSGEKPTKQISQARIYRRGLVPGEVLNNYYATKGRFGL